MRIYAPLNTEPFPILQEIEVATSLQIPSFHIIGLPSPEVAEAKERIRSAVEASGFEFPRRRVVLNLSPASIRKRGTGLDLAMALAVLAAQVSSSKIESQSPERIGAWGELSLNGTVKSAAQVTRSLYASWVGKVERLFISEGDFPEMERALEWILETQILPGRPPSLIPITHLKEAWEIIEGKLSFTQRPSSSLSSPANRGGEKDTLTHSPHGTSSRLLPLTPSLERLISIAISGQHHILLLGPKGVGKSQALEWISALQPQPSPKDRLIQALIEELHPVHPLAKSGPFSNSGGWMRRVSTQSKPSALSGGTQASLLRPGEFSLAHGGVLLADELLEWARDSRESLREPLERGSVTLTRAEGRAELPARFLLAATGNLCPCGGLPPEFPASPMLQGLTIQRCDCGFSIRKKYLERLSGPILDRIDLVALIYSDMTPRRSEKGSREPVESIKEQIAKTQSLLKDQWKELPGLLPPSQLEKILEAHPSLSLSLSRMTLGSLRSRHKVLRIALSVAAWDGEPLPKEGHFLEAYRYRRESVLAPIQADRS